MAKITCLCGCLFNFLGVAIIALGFLAAYVIVPAYVQTMVQSELIIKPSDYEAGRKNDTDADATPCYESYYVYNITNKAAILNGEKPIVHELGPYTYRKYSFYYDAEFNADETEYKYEKYSTYHALPERSVGDPETDTVTVVNHAYLTAVKQAGDEDTLKQASAPMYIGLTLQELIKQNQSILVGAWAMVDGNDPSTVYSTGLAAKQTAWIANDKVTWSYALPVDLSSMSLDVATVWSAFTRAHYADWSVFMNSASTTAQLNAATVNLATSMGIPMPAGAESFGVIADWFLNTYLFDAFPVGKCAGLGMTCSKDNLTPLFIGQWLATSLLNGGKFNTVLPPFSGMPQWELATSDGPTIAAFTTDATTLPKLFSGATAMYGPVQYGTIAGQMGADNAVWFETTYGIPQASYPAFKAAFGPYMYTLGTAVPTYFFGLGYGLFRTMTVHDYLVNHKDILTGKDLSFLVNKTAETGGEIPAAGSIPNWFYTGKDDIEKLRSIATFQGQTDLTKWWGSQVADVSIEGCSEGEQFAPFQEAPGPSVCLLIKELMRPLSMASVDDEYKIKGIVTTRYMVESTEFQSGTENPKNAKFFQGISGMVNRTKDLGGTPLYVSKGGWLDVETSVTSSVTGVVADATKHETSIYVILLMGATIKANQRLMMSAAYDLNPLEGNPPYVNLTKGQMFPMFYIDRDVELTDDQADTLKALLDLISLAILLCIVLGTGVGGFFIMIGSCCLMAHKRAGSRAKIIPVDAEMEVKGK